MRITHKIVTAVMAISIFIMFAGNTIFAGMLKQHIIQEENKQIQNSINSTIQYIDQLKLNYERTSNDWAHWDETYDFINSHNPEYVSKYMNAKDFINLNVNFMIFYDKNQLIEARYYDYELNDFKPLSPGLIAAIEKNIQKSDTEDTHTRLISNGADYYIMSIAATTDSLMKQQANGRFVIGRSIDSDLLKIIERFTNGSVSFSLINNLDKEIADKLLQDESDNHPVYIDSVRNDSVSVYSLLQEPEDSEASIVLYINVFRDFYLAEMKHLRLMSGIYSAVVLLASIISLLFINKFAIKPIMEMSRKIRSIDPTQEHFHRMDVHGTDEISVLGNVINAMFNAIESERNEQKQTEQKLMESERSKSVLLSNLQGMAYRCKYDRDWTMLFISQGCFELTGYKPESLLYNEEISFNDLIDPEYRELIWNTWAKTIELRTIFREEYPIKTASGQIKWVFEQGRGVYDENGQVEALEGLIIDITDRKKREDEIRYLNYHDVMTGLYNRRFFDKEKKHLDNKSQLPLSIIIGDINGLKLINDALGHAEGDKLIIETAIILRSYCREGDVLARVGGDEFCILLPKTDNETAWEILKKINMACEAYNNNASSEAHYINISLGYATKEAVEENIDLVVKVAEDYMYKRKLLEHKSSHSAIVASIKTTMLEKSQETEEHAERLTALTKAVGIKLDLSELKLDELELLATLHDIGKVGIDDQILNKQGKLTEEEWIEMKKHPEIGYRIAMSSPELMSISDYILCHHERWDGKGYPQGLKGEDIPLLSRVLAVADAYDAMTEDRTYRRAMPVEAALAEIKNNAGTQFDSRIAHLFVGIIKGETESDLKYPFLSKNIRSFGGP